MVYMQAHNSRTGPRQCTKTTKKTKKNL